MFKREEKTEKEINDVIFRRIEEFVPNISKKDIKALILCVEDEGCIYLNENYIVEVADCRSESTEIINIYGEVCIRQCHPSIKHFDENAKYDLGILLGEAVAAAFRGNEEKAIELLSAADKYITSREIEITRKWIMESCIYGLGVLVLSFAIGKLLIGFWGTESYAFIFQYITYGLCGGIGTAFSIMHSGGKLRFTCVAGRQLVTYEVFAKYVIGMIAAILMVISLQIGIIGSSLISETNRELSYILVSVVAGFSERMVPSLMEKIEKKAEED